MSTKPESYRAIGDVKGNVERAGKKASTSPLMEGFTRLGYGVRGLIYLIMGMLALNVALGKGGLPTNQQGAIAEISKQPFGHIILWIVLIGLIAYSIWGLFRAIFDPLNKGHDLKGFLARGGFLVSAGSYAILIPTTYSFISGAGSSPTNGQSLQSLGPIMSKPWGHLAIGVLGLAVIAGGLSQVIAGFKNTFDKQIKTYALTADQAKLVTFMGRFGTAIRGFILVLVGLLLVQAAYRSNPNQGIGIDSALAALMRQPYGIWLLGIVAIGLIIFGLYSILSAAWYRSRR